MTTAEKNVKASAEQIRYANILFYGAWSGIALMIITYLIYVLGILPPHIPLHEVPNYWGMAADQYLHEADIGRGWAWAGMLGKGDFLNFLGIAFLGVLTIIGYLTLIPAYIKKKDTAYAIVAILEVLVLLSAASGFLGSGGH
ncbi:MAG: DUF1634 domain-containing protein [Desulfohalobiaceae bacterium]|nr:DUF1634 domain-containing protein [Desulfohalobiaceae bacterium]